MLKRHSNSNSRNYFINNSEYSEAFYIAVVNHWEAEYAGEMETSHIDDIYKKENLAALYVVTSMVGVDQINELISNYKIAKQKNPTEKISYIKEITSLDSLLNIGIKPSSEEQSLLKFVENILNEDYSKIPFVELGPKNRIVLKTALEILIIEMGVVYDLWSQQIEEQAWINFSKDKDVETFLEKTDHEGVFRSANRFTNMASMIEAYFKKDLMSNRLDNIPKNKLMYMYLISWFVNVNKYDIPPYLQSPEGLETLDIRYGQQTKVCQRILDFARAILKNRLDIYNIEQFYEDIEETELEIDLNIAVKEMMGTFACGQNKDDLEYMLSALSVYHNV